jgi:twitching motility protein PilT
MAKIERLLSLVLDQNANELRLGTDREPKMLAFGTTKRLNLPLMDGETVREMLGDILSPEREALLAERGRVDAGYEAPVGFFALTLTSRTDGFDVVFRKSSAKAVEVAASSTSLPVAPSVSLPIAAPASVPMPVAAPVVSMPIVSHDLTSLVAQAEAMRASDIHLAEGQLPFVRVDGRLIPLEVGPLDLPSIFPLGDSETSRDLGLDIPGVGRVRAHIFRSDGARSASIRLMPKLAPSLASLQFPVPLDDLITLPHGLVLVCGAAGSGKSTTLAALAQEALRRRSVVLVTLEDPIEYTITGSERSVLRRRQIGRDVRDFASGLRDALREDPDVILIGEMRDAETISLALTAAETGHLVFATMHSRSAASAIERIVDTYTNAQQIRVQLADSLRAVVAQRLLPRAHGSGRVPALEVLRVNHAAASMIRESKTQQLGTVLQAGRKEGMITLERCLADRVTAGEIRLEDARAAANDQASLTMQLQR